MLIVQRGTHAHPEGASMATRIDKLIVTNGSVLKKKYGRAGMTKLNAALRALIAADKQRGLRTLLVQLDSATALKRYQAPVVKDAASPKQNKAAIDALYRRIQPSYLMILGATDVIPHQDMLNPVQDAGDPDAVAYGDLPYACEAPYSQRIEGFISPTRVIGRLPDLTGAKDPAYLLSLLQTATRYQSRSASDYAAHLGMSAQVWRGSTELSLKAIFGPGSSVNLSPPKGPKWLPEQLQTRAHFINCHGSPADPQFYGQRGNTYPVAHAARSISGLNEGTVVAAECCYGAELYDPTLAGGTSGICNTYLGQGAYGFFGSSTIAYGPADENGAADLICQYFFKHMLEGASLGRAALQARQDFIQKANLLDPIDLKTLAQFNLLADPAIHPVKAPAAERVLPMKKGGPPATPDGAARVLRRTNLAFIGDSLAQSTSVAKIRTQPQPASVRQTLRGELDRAVQVLAEAGAVTQVQFRSYSVQAPKRAGGLRGAKLLGAAQPPGTVHLAMGVVAERGKRRDTGELEGAPERQLVAVVGTETPDGLVVRRLYSHGR